MVMTENRSPRLSLLGVALAAGLAMAGAVVTPALACPEKDKGKAKGGGLAVESVVVPAVAEIAGVTSEVVSLPEVALLAESARGTTFESFMAGQPDDDLRELLARLNKLEAELAALRAYVGDVEGRSARRSRSGTADAIAELNRARALEREVRAEAERSDRRAEAMARAGQARARAAEAAAKNLAAEAVGRQRAARERAAATDALAQEARVRSGFGRRGNAEAPAGGRAVAAPGQPQSYYLSSPGKLKDLTDLMARADVPVLIERHQGKIVVHGNAQVQRTFAAFVKMIDPDARVPRSSGRNNQGAGVGGVAPAPPGAQRAPSSDSGAGIGGAGRRAPSPLRPPSAPAAGARGGSAGPASNDPRVRREAVRRQHEQAISVWRDQVKQLQQQRREIEQQMRQIERQRREMQNDADATEVRAEEVESRVEDIQEALEERLEELHEVGKDEREQLEVMVVRMQSELVDASNQAASLMARHAESEQQAEMLERYADALERQLEDLDAHADKLEARIEDLLDDIDEGEEEGEERDR